MNLAIEKISIVNTGCECVVNAANSGLKAGGGVCGAIFDAAGYTRLQEACNKIGGCKTGSAVITPGFKLSKYIIHAVGPVYKGGTYNESQELYDAYVKSVSLAYANSCQSIAFPLISAGIYGYPEKEAFEVALKALKDWDKDHPDNEMDIMFAIPAYNTYQLGLNCAKEMNMVITRWNV